MGKRALLSVSDKQGIVELAQGLVKLGYEILSTGGTAKILVEQGVVVTPVSQVTGFPEILEGRVKTLHPKIHGGILAKRTPDHLEQLKEQEIAPIDLVVVNLYPFKETVAKPEVTLEEAIENIDIGGPAMVRAAAKNHQYVAVVVNPQRYGEILSLLEEQGEIPLAVRRQLAFEAFSHTAHYDAMISQYLSGILAQEKEQELPQEFTLGGKKIQDLRYGENPHQKAAFYQVGDYGLAAAEKYQGKELSFNNLMDLEAAWNLVLEFDEPACAIIKHTNPCGVAVAKNLKEAYTRAYEADPVSAFGGIVGLNREVDEETAKVLVEIFLEAVVAPGYTPQALEILKEKPNLRVLAVKAGAKGKTLDIKTVSGGFLVQEKDQVEESPQWQWVTDKKVEEEKLLKDLQFAWKVVKHVKSNAIVTVKDGVTTGIGPGQTNRVGAAKIALSQAGPKAKGGVLASDAFFPFRDTVDLAAQYGISAIIQPGGAIRDEESITACNEHGIAMAFTGRRHFRH